MDVILNGIPFATNQYLRIGYVLRTWEFERHGLTLRKIEILDAAKRAAAPLLTFEGEGLPMVTQNSNVTWGERYGADHLFNYYIPIQLPLPLESKVPRRITHRLTFDVAKRWNTMRRHKVVLRGGTFKPHVGEAPVVIASPLRGKNLWFHNQSSSGYHFNFLVFLNHTIYHAMGYAFDSMQFNDELNAWFAGDPTKNESYFNYGNPVYSVADGTVVVAHDGEPEQARDKYDLPITLANTQGNHVIVDLGHARYATYAHLKTNSITAAGIHVGQTLKKGDVIGALGNSGNSQRPHLHFQITDGPDPIFSYGVPFVFERYTKAAEFTDPGDSSSTTRVDLPQEYAEAMMEETMIVDVK